MGEREGLSRECQTTITITINPPPVERREQRAESREQRVQSTEYRVQSREQRAERERVAPHASGGLKASHFGQRERQPKMLALPHSLQLLSARNVLRGSESACWRMVYLRRLAVVVYAKRARE
jgi:hypothetical protein